MLSGKSQRLRGRVCRLRLVAARPPGENKQNQTRPNQKGQIAVLDIGRQAGGALYFHIQHTWGQRWQDCANTAIRINGGCHAGIGRT